MTFNQATDDGIRLGVMLSLLYILFNVAQGLQLPKYMTEIAVIIFVCVVLSNAYYFVQDQKTSTSSQ